jgi:hypothetical protein
MLNLYWYQNRSVNNVAWSYCTSGYDRNTYARVSRENIVFKVR